MNFHGFSEFTLKAGSFHFYEHIIPKTGFLPLERHSHPSNDFYNFRKVGTRILNMRSEKE